MSTEPETDEDGFAVLALFGRAPADIRWQSLVDSAEYLALITYYYLRSTT